MSGAVAERSQTQVRAAPEPFAYVDIYRASAAERIQLVREGVPAAEAKRMIAELDLDQRVVLDALNLKTATVNRKAARAETLSPDESERVIGMAKLVGQIEAMVEESGASEPFDAAAWLSQWLREPIPALGGQRPIELLDTMEGQSLVADALGRIQSGAYA